MTLETMINGTFIFFINYLKLLKFQRIHNCNYIYLNLFVYSEIESIFIPPHVTTIKSEAFKRCDNLKKVVLAYNYN